MSRQISRTRSYRSRLPQDLHLTVPRSWVTPDGRHMRRPFQDTQVQSIEALRKRPGMFSIRLFCKTPNVAIGLLDRFSRRKFSEKGIFCEPFVPRSERKKRRNIPLKRPRNSRNLRPEPRRSRSVRISERQEEPCIVDFESELIAFESMDRPTRRPRGKCVVFGSFDEDDEAEEELYPHHTITPKSRRFSFPERTDLNEMACYDSDSEMADLG